MSLDQERYRAFRASNVPAAQAAEWARVPLPHFTPHDAWDGVVDQLALTWRDQVVTVRWEADEYPDASAPGTFSDIAGPGSRKLFPERHSFRRFTPQTTAAEHRGALARKGMSRQVAEETAQRYVTEDLRSARGLSYVPCTLTATVRHHDVELAEAWLGGVSLSESWPTPREVVEYLATDTSLLDDVVAAAASKLAELRG